ncbi:MAG: L,D-transpeptidase [Nanoarchaeota archaeon]
MNRYALAALTFLTLASYAHADPYVEVDISDRKLYFHGTAELEYPVGVGRNKYQTPTGEFTINEIIEYPDWCPDAGTPWLTDEQRDYVKEHTCIPNNLQLNPLNLYWIDLSAPGIGIHDRYDDDGIGKASSHGCVRMHTADISKLVEHLQKGMKVVIHD